MRKLTVLLAVFVIITVSCKKGSNNPDQEPPEEPGINVPKELIVEAPPEAERNALPMKLVMTDENGQSETYTITYLPNKRHIDRVTNQNGATEVYHYNGDLIDKIDYSRDGTDYSKFEYQNNTLVRETHYRNSQLAAKKEYTYPEGKQIKVTEFAYKSGKWERADDPVNLEFDHKGNLTKAESGKIKVGILYDDKNAPFLNATGWSKIHFTGGIPLGDNTHFEDVLARRNNPLKTTATEAGNSLLDVAFTYEFNDTQNPKFPTKILGKENGKTKFTVAISYSIQSGGPDDGQEIKEDNSLPLELTMTYAGVPSETTSITYQTDSKKIDKIRKSKNGGTETYHYDGDRIVKIDFGSNGDDYKSFEYDATTKRVSRETQYRSNIAKSQIRYSYISNNVLTTTEYKYENNDWILSGESLSLEIDGNGDVIKVKSGDLKVEANVSYDTAKKSPFSNITGWAEIHFTGGIPLGDNMGAEDIIGRKSNPIKTIAKEGATTLLDMNFTYEYNNNQHPKFPTKITGTGKPFTMTIVYK